MYPQAEQESNIFEEIGEILTVGVVVNLVVLACVLRATTKKSRQLFGGGKKSAPTEKILATPMSQLGGECQGGTSYALSDGAEERRMS